jgi:hypothetical protein
MADKATELSFVRKHPKGGGANFWAVKPSGDYIMDCRRGRELALEFMKFEHADNEGPANTLAHIVSAIVAAKDNSGLVVGFCTTLVGCSSFGWTPDYLERARQYYVAADKEADEVIAKTSRAYSRRLPAEADKINPAA